jgi:hypothetical protein
MRDARLVKWAKEVSRTPLLQTTTKVLLLDLYIDGIDADWKISIPRAVMAERMGVSARQVNTRFADAVRVGFLRQEIHGWKGTTAVYMASTPNGAAVPRPRRVRSGREPWRESDAKQEGFKHPLESDSRKRGGPALPVDNTACRAKAGSAGVLPVVRQATNQPAHPGGVLNHTPTDTGTTAYLTATCTATATADVVAAALLLCARGQDWLQREGLLTTKANLPTVDLGPSFLVARCNGAR